MSVSQSHQPKASVSPLAGIRVALFVEDEKTFLFSAAYRTIEALRKQGAEVAGVGVFPSKLGRQRGIGIPLWYLRVYGPGATFLLASYKLLQSIRRLAARFGTARAPSTWDGLGRRLGLRVQHFSSPNHKDARAFLNSLECDVLFVMLPYVLSRKVLLIPRLGTINKHAALLPNYRGLMPYVWSIIGGSELGVTFHSVVEEIDAGPVLTQRRFGPASSSPSLLHFYRQVFDAFPEMACESAEALVTAEPSPAPTEPGEYFSLPTRPDYLRFRRAGGKVARFSDLW